MESFNEGLSSRVLFEIIFPRFHGTQYGVTLCGLNLDEGFISKRVPRLLRWFCNLQGSHSNLVKARTVSMIKIEDDSWWPLALFGRSLAIGCAQSPHARGVDRGSRLV